MHKLRRINIFDRKPSQLSEDSALGFITCGAVAADGSAWVGNTAGEVLKIDRGMKPSTWRLQAFAHIKGIRASKQQIVVLGNDGSEDKYKSFHLFRTSPDGTPSVSKEMKAPGKVTCFDVTHLFTFIALGLESGQVIVTRGGDVHGDKQYLRTVLGDNKRAITTVHFLETPDGTCFLFACTVSQVSTFRVSADGEITLINTDTSSGALSSAVAALATKQGQLLVAGEAALFGFDAVQGNISAVPFDGRKRSLTCWRQNIAVVSDGEDKRQQLTIFSSYPAARFIAFQAAFQDDISLLLGGAFDGRSTLVFTCRLGGSTAVVEIVEKSVAHQLQVLAKKSLFDFAIEIATKEKQSAETIADLFTMHGDSFFSAGQEESALAVYCHSLDVGIPVEPSHVISKFLLDQPLGKKRCFAVIQYLLKLHDNQRPHGGPRLHPEHSHLLIQCYKSIKDHDSLNRFLTGLSPAALANLLQDNLELAENIPSELLGQRLQQDMQLFLRLLCQRGEWEIIKQALKQLHAKEISDLLDTFAYGIELVKGCPELESSIPKAARIGAHARFCATGEASPDPPIDYESVSGLFLYLELHLRAGNIPEAVRIGRLAITKGLAERVLILAAMFKCRELEEVAASMANKQLHVLATTGELPPTMAARDTENNLWLHTLAVQRRCGRKARTVFLKDRPGGPELLISLAEKTEGATLGEIKSSLFKQLKSLEESAANKRYRIGQDADEMFKMEDEVDNLQKRAKVIQPQGKMCAECKKTLVDQPPVAYFLCGHFYHLHCCTVDLNVPPSCPLCSGEATHKENLRLQRASSTAREDEMFKYLETAAANGEAFEVVANYLGRGLFCTRKRD